MNNESFDKSRGERIAYAIENSNKKQKDIADAAEVSPQAVNKWIRTGKISKKNLFVLASETGFSAIWIQDGSGAMHAPHLSEVENSAGQYVPAIDLDCLEKALEGLDLLEETFTKMKSPRKRVEFLWELYKVNKELMDEGAPPLDAKNIIRLARFMVK